jgi:hypothetical protein
MSAVTTNAGLVRILELLDTDITHLGMGTGAAPVVGDSLLNSEALRKVATSVIDGYTLTKEAEWDTSEANGVNYTTTGLFGDGAAIGLDTGTLICGGSINITKTSMETLTVSIEILVEAVNT